MRCNFYSEQIRARNLLLLKSASSEIYGLCIFFNVCGASKSPSEGLTAYLLLGGLESVMGSEQETMGFKFLQRRF